MKTLLIVYCIICASFASAQLEPEDFTTTDFPAAEEDFTEPPSTDPPTPSLRLDSRARILTDAEDGGLFLSRNPVVSPSLEFFENNRAAPATVPLPNNRILVDDNLTTNNDWTPLTWPSTLKITPSVTVQPLRSTRTRITRPLPSVVAAPARASTAGIPQLQRPPVVTFGPSDAFRKESAAVSLESIPTVGLRLEPTPVLQPEVPEPVTSTSSVLASPIENSSQPVGNSSDNSVDRTNQTTENPSSVVSTTQGHANTTTTTDITLTNDTLSTTASLNETSTSAPAAVVTETLVQLANKNNETDEKPIESSSAGSVEVSSSATPTTTEQAVEPDKLSVNHTDAGDILVPLASLTTPIPLEKDSSPLESTTAPGLAANGTTAEIVLDLNSTTVATQPAVPVTSTTTESVFRIDEEPSKPSETSRPSSSSHWDQDLLNNTNPQEDAISSQAVGHNTSGLLPRDDEIVNPDALANTVDGEVPGTTVEPFLNDSIVLDVVKPEITTPSAGLTISAATSTSSPTTVSSEATSVVTEKPQEAKEDKNEEFPSVSTSVTESTTNATSPAVSTTTSSPTTTAAAASETNITVTHSFTTSPPTTANAVAFDDNSSVSEPSSTTVSAVQPTTTAVVVTSPAPETTTATPNTSTSEETILRSENSTVNPTSSIPVTELPTTSPTSLLPTTTAYSPTAATDDTASSASTEESISTTPQPPYNSDVVIAATVSVILLLCVAILLFVLVMYRRKRSRAAQGTCQPARLDAYSLDNVSPSQTWQRGKIRSTLRASKRSYSNQAFDDPVAPSTLLTAAQLSLFMEKSLNGIEDEFQQIPVPSSVHLEDLPQGTENKNRYANVLPYPETRVRIRVSDPNADDTEDNYINANYIRGIKEEPKCYVACQAPLDTTVADFWQMVWETQSRVIVQLTDLTENGIARCAEYLPPSEVLDCHRLYGDFQITLKSRELRENYVVSHVQVKHMEDNLVREVRHLWYSAWPTAGVPDDVKTVISLLQEARKGLSKENSGPVVVHCSPGTGRTGTVLAIDISMRQLDLTRSIDIPRCVYKLRQDRSGCVQTKEQYIFIYKAVNHYASQLSNAAFDSI